MKTSSTRLAACLAPTMLVVTSCGGGNAEVAVEERIVEVGVVEVQPREVVDWAVLSADLAAERRATLAAEVAGSVESMRVDTGDRVARGAVIATIDQRALAQRVAEAEALHRQAVEEAERARTLFDKRSITRQSLTGAETGLEVAAARLASARLALDKSTIRAPWDGHVAARHIEAGDYLQPGQPVIEIVADLRLEVRADVAAPDAPLMAVGRPVEVTVEGFGDEVFGGEITRVGATLDPTSRTLQVKAMIDNADRRLKAGMYGRMRFPRRRYEAALVVPLSAFLDAESGKYLYRLDAEGVARRVEPQLGAILGNEVIVRSGLEAGERVVVEGQFRVSEGMRVEARSVEG